MRCKVKVQTWWCVEATVEIEGRTEREVRELALVAGHKAHEGKTGYITKNKTTILSRDGVD